MERHQDPARALASLRERWGAAAPRRGTEVFGALATAPLPGERARPDEWATPQPRPVPGMLPGVAPRQRPATTTGDAIPTGFAALDALLAGGGLPRAGTVALAGTGSSGSTTLAMRVLASAQENGALAAWIDCPRSLDPVEAVARGVNLDWLAVLVPDSLGQAFAMAGAMLQSRAIDVLVLDLGPGRESPPAMHAAAVPAQVPAVQVPAAHAPATAPRPFPATSGKGRPAPRPADQLARLAAFARRTGALLLVLIPPGTAPALRATVDEAAGLRLELARRSWIRLGREVVGQRTEVRVARDRHGAPDRRTSLRILYAEGGPRDRCLARDELLAEEPVAHLPVAAAPAAQPPPPVVPRSFPFPERPTSTDAPPPPLLAAPRAPARPGEPTRTVVRAAGPRRTAVG